MKLMKTEVVAEKEGRIPVAGHQFENSDNWLPLKAWRKWI